MFVDDEDYDENEDEEDGCDYGFEFCENPQTKELGTCTTDCQQYLCATEADADGGTDTWVCEDCGCTDITPCQGGCCWTRKNLCSVCAQKRKQNVSEQK